MIKTQHPKHGGKLAPAPTTRDFPKISHDTARITLAVIESHCAAVKNETLHDMIQFLKKYLDQQS